MELVLASRNAGKLREIQASLTDLPLTLRSVAEFPDVPPVLEDGATFEANARKKARETAQYLGRWVLADDSGLEVRALGGRPGVCSARYAGEGASDAENNAKLLEELRDIPAGQRQARFVCVLAVATPTGREWVVRGHCEGVIASEPHGQQGFGYDPLFWVLQLKKTFGEVDHQLKAQLSHRGQALARLRRELPVLLEKLAHEKKISATSQ
jgi:XTP/dITP diphosphohydrolase